MNLKKYTRNFNPDWNYQYSEKEFEDKYTYNGTDLGCTYSELNSQFKLWSPFAKEVIINLYESGDYKKDDLIESFNMNRGAYGTWYLDLSGDKKNLYYTYTVKFDRKYDGIYDAEICDPYARTCGVNGIRAMITDLKSTNPENWDKDSYPNDNLNPADYIIYELHTRDLSSLDCSGIKNKGKFLGLTEKNTTVYNKGIIKTGIDHILDLGVTHIHLLPIYDYATIDESKEYNSREYNWGYDPLNYNALEGSYSTNPNDGNIRIKEFKNTVKFLHDNGISVIMDVVYNHTYNEEFCFNRAVPGYFYRIDSDGNKSDGSRCGNDTASERSMVSKFIADSVEYWAKEYHIDGFRFDLVGLIDVDTINEIRKRVDKINPKIFLYGEGWDLETETTKEDIKLAKQGNIDLLDRFAMFNDDLRDSIKGSVFDEEEKGFISGNVKFANNLKKSISGFPKWSSSPVDVINYTSCHDNYTLFDKIRLCNPNISMDDAIKENLLAISIVMLSQGVPLLHAGEEILRTKTDSDGSYVSDSVRSDDSVNGIDYSKLEDEKYMEVYNYYKGLVKLRKKYNMFRIDNKTDAEKCISFKETGNDGVIEYHINKNGHEVITIFNATENDYELTDLNGYIVLAEDKSVNENGIRKSDRVENVKPKSTFVVYR